MNNPTLELDEFKSISDFLNSNDTASDFRFVPDLPLEDIYPDELQPRFKNLTEEGVQDLVATIESAGRVLQPIVVRPKDDKGHKIYMGGRRWLASTILDKKTIPAIITSESNFDSVMLVQLIENEARKNLDPIELGKAYLVLKNENYTQKEIAKKLGKSETHVAECILMVEMDENPEFDFIRELFDKDISKDTSTLSALIRLAKKDNAKTRNLVTWAVQNNSLTRAWVKSLNASKFDKPIEEIFSVTKLGNASIEDTKSAPKDFSDEKEINTHSAAQDPNDELETISHEEVENEFELVQEQDGVAHDNTSNSAKLNSKKVSSISVTYSGKIAEVIMDKVSTKDGFAWILFEGKPTEVDVADLSILAIS